MNVDVFIISRYDELDRPYVSTTCPTPERIEALKKLGYQIHRGELAIPTISDMIDEADACEGDRL